jgi:hypothetical protein
LNYAIKKRKLVFGIIVILLRKLRRENHIIAPRDKPECVKDVDMMLRIYLRIFVNTELVEPGKSPVLNEFDICEFSGQPLTQPAL